MANTLQDHYCVDLHYASVTNITEKRITSRLLLSSAEMYYKSFGLHISVYNVIKYMYFQQPTQADASMVKYVASKVTSVVT